jgi:hypothetical protein
MNFDYEFTPERQGSLDHFLPDVGPRRRHGDDDVSRDKQRIVRRVFRRKYRDALPINVTSFQFDFRHGMEFGG